MRENTYTGDYVVRGTAADGRVRVFAVRSTELVAKARDIHKTFPVVTAALGRLLSAAAMMGTMMKGEEDVLSLTVKGDGPIASLTVSADSHGHVKGFPGNPAVDIPRKRPGKLDVGAAVGKGILTVTMDLGLRDPYQGQVELQTGEIGDDLAYYFTVSEQTPSAVGLGVMLDRDSSVKEAGGFLVQLLPDADEEIIEALERRLASIRSVTEMMEEGLTPEDILHEVLGDIPFEILEKEEVSFFCNCSRDKVSRALAAIQKSELESMIEDGESIEVKCFYCNTAYEFTVDEMKEILIEREQSAEIEDSAESENA